MVRPLDLEPSACSQKTDYTDGIHSSFLIVMVTSVAREVYGCLTPMMGVY